MKNQRILKVFIKLLFLFVVIISTKTCCRVFLGDWFPVNTTSMIPNIIPGDIIWVNKTIFGARLYCNLGFFEGKQLRTFRIKGLSNIQYGDIVVFNEPMQQSDKSTIEFRINRVIVKRCIGLPGDTIVVKRQNEQPKNRILSLPKYTGILYIPKKGDTIYMNNTNIKLYHSVILFETNGILPRKFHIFTNNYYYMLGDNILYSYDSRYFGFIPEDFIIGISKLIIFPDIKEKNLTEVRLFKIIK